MNKAQILIGMFFVLFTANAIYCHYCGLEVIEEAKQVSRMHDRLGDDMPPGYDMGIRRWGQRLMLLNIPLMLTMGTIVHDPKPAPGVLYWIALVLGSWYVPLIATLAVYMLITPPSTNFPGVDWNTKPEDFDD